jgi:hypothetical protein
MKILKIYLNPEIEHFEGWRSKPKKILHSHSHYCLTSVSFDNRGMRTAWYVSKFSLTKPVQRAIQIQDAHIRFIFSQHKKIANIMYQMDVWYLD